VTALRGVVNYHQEVFAK